MGPLDTPGQHYDPSRRRWEPRGFYLFRRLARWFLWGFLVASICVYVGYIVEGMTAMAIAIVLCVLMLLGAGASFLGMALTALHKRRDETPPADPAISDDERVKL
jgi:hypothetical protein